MRAPKRPTRPSIPRRRRPLQSAGYRPTDTANSRLIAKTHLRNGINGRELTPTIGKRLYSRRRWLRDQSRSRLQRQTRSAAMPDPERRYTKFEIAEQLRVLAKHSGEPNKGKLRRNLRRRRNYLPRPLSRTRRNLHPLPLSPIRSPRQLSQIRRRQNYWRQLSRTRRHPRPPPACPM